ncbi:UDP-GlcNAc--UDP-phosphate GlcNAc-1-phosphate transferase [Macellibacteroides fermentans]|uniref:UDP-GlcNAc--UDP-phosphate GlcNAc-1-phosphate transferase n=1 Tax=Macellibacteroides fermentans TaxID=879969 RepID=UPI00352FABD4
MIYIIFIILLVFAELLYFRIADHFNIIDNPNERSSHSSVTLRGGGLLFWVGVLFYFLMSGWHYPWFFAGLTLVAAISFADDVKLQSPIVRLVLQFIGLLLMSIQWQLFDFSWIIVVLVIVVSVGVLNAFNFMDGINGITGGYSLAVLVSLWYVNNYVTAFVDNNLIYLVFLALLVFNFFNFRIKAKCFAGDVGAVSIAFILIFILGMLIIKTGDLSYIAFLLVYGVDSVLTIVHRILLKENITEPHRMHLYQLLSNELKVPQLLVSTIYAVLQLLISFGFIMFYSVSLWYLVIVAVLLTVVYLIIKRKYFHLHRS